jgi:hypothetical protein
MSRPSSKSFDCVRSIRDIRDPISAEIADMSYDELTAWLRLHEYSDPRLQRLAEKARQQPGRADNGARRP